MIERDESIALARATLSGAGWKPMPGWDDYISGSCVGGVDPWGSGHIKNLEMIRPGHPLYGPDTPDEHHEAAAWLVEHAKRLRLEPVAPAPEAAETAAHETHGETGEDAQSDDLEANGFSDPSSERSASEDGADASSEPTRGDALRDDYGLERDDQDGDARRDGEAAVLDADFTVTALETIELIEPSEPDFGGELLEFEKHTARTAAEHDAVLRGEPPLDRFIGLDDLDRRRSLRMGDVMRYARSIMPTWGVEQDAELAGLRNFAMGVSEGRWADDPAKRDTLDALEAQLRRIRQIETARDQRVEFLEAATREEVEAFVVEADWP